GGGIYTSGPLTMTGGVVSGNGAFANGIAIGGGVLAQGAAFTATDAQILSNGVGPPSAVGFGEGRGGGAIRSGTLSLARVTVAKNLAYFGVPPAPRQNILGAGLAVFSGSTATLVDTTIGGPAANDGNRSFGVGGGVVVGPTAVFTMTGGTIQQN